METISITEIGHGFMVDFPANLFHVAKGKVRATSPPSTPVASQTARDALAKGKGAVFLLCFEQSVILIYSVSTFFLTMVRKHSVH